MYAPNSNGIIGDTVRAASPELAYQIGQYFKENKLKNEIDGGNRPEEQSANHLLAHAILGAAVSYATGNNITTVLYQERVVKWLHLPYQTSYLIPKTQKSLPKNKKTPSSAF
ncbi:hypothetical protein [Moraxella nonliquefaciens]|uniref:hypothetical protein n=1 Tax=Moraxella nonliquefaciens TaxID=478 RepID=UPI0018E1454E|nr:hypothetical protein [Moraxella nonliquefaciens]QQC29920.1 hypothetical protein I6H63_01065 [Moraxella nonliquefaciens]